MRGAIGISIVAALLIAACAPARPAGPAGGSPGGSPVAKQGGIIRVSMNQEPDTLSPLFGGGLRATNTVNQAIYNGLWVVNEKGEFEPDLAAEVPTVQNGGVSADGRTITVKLKRDVKWADGRPFTADDVKWNYDVIMSPQTPIGKTTMRNIETFTVKDPHTIEWKMANVFPAYLTLFSYPGGQIVPKHAFEGVAMEQLQGHAFNRRPFGTGPFRVTAWEAASHITLEPNPNYFKGKPKLDRLVFRITPDKATQIAQLRANETDIAVDLAEPDTAELERIAGWRILSVAAHNADRFFLNLAEPGVADGSRPHPILSDKRVRQALQLGINKQELVDRVLLGKSRVAVGDYVPGQHWAAADLQASRHDPAAAQRLLDEAGWRAGADGIREKDGRKLTLTVHGVTGNRLRDDVAALVQAGWRRIGVDMQTRNVAAAALVGSWANQGVVARGNFDIAFFSVAAGGDPLATLGNRFHSGHIPHEGRTAGNNTMRFKNAEVDRLADEAATTLDQAKRKTNYLRIQQIVADELPKIYLYYRAHIEAVSDRVVGPKSHPSRWLTWNAHEWGLR